MTLHLRSGEQALVLPGSADMAWRFKIQNEIICTCTFAYLIMFKRRGNLQYTDIFIVNNKCLMSMVFEIIIINAAKTFMNNGND